jgi:hypothetical protein
LHSEVVDEPIVKLANNFVGFLVSSFGAEPTWRIREPEEQPNDIVAKAA